jgi:hypothetical protein
LSFAEKIFVWIHMSSLMDAPKYVQCARSFAPGGSGSHSMSAIHHLS